MSNKSFPEKLSVGQRLLTVTALAVVAIAALLYVTRGQSDQSAAIGLAAQQKALNQQLTRELILSSEGVTSDYASTQEALRQAVSLLKNGGVHAFGSVAPATDAKLSELLSQQTAAIESQVRFGSHFLRTSAESAADRTTAVMQLVENTRRFDEGAQAVANRLAEIGADTQAASSKNALVVGVVFIGLSIAWSVWCAQAGGGQLGVSSGELRRIAEDRLSAMGNRLRANAENTCDEARMASGAADQMNGIAQSLATAVEEFEASIREIAGNASNAASVARQAVEATGTTNTTISRLGESSAEISNVIKVINSIAEQTNLLALNATIEAARAGEAGKGFAVVANEVKELAKETSKATEDIVRRIETIQSDTEEAVNAIGLVSEIITQINESQNAIAGAVEEQSAMTSEISRNISEVVNSSDEIVQSIYKVSDSAKNTTTAANLDEFAEELLEVVA